MATAGLSLIRLHSEKMRPPRTLWVPYELGRPLGAPNDTALQTRILRALIALLDAPSGPVLEDFPDDDVTAADPNDFSGMTCPIAFNHAAAQDTSLTGQVRREIAQLLPWYDLARERRGRSTFGAAGLDIHALVGLLIAWSEGTPPASEGNLPHEATLKLAVEDLKAFYLEAAGAQPSPMTSAGFAHWLWHDTAGGRLLVAVHKACVAAPNPAWRVVGANYIIPRAQWSQLGINATSWQAEKK